MYTEEQIKELVQCPKTIVDPPKKINEGRESFFKKAFTLSSIDGNYHFNGFITQNLTFPENFSIGLSYNPKDEKGSIVLLRCNGPHGGIKNIPHHASCHIHSATAERINNGLKPEGEIELTEDYATIETAIHFFLKKINLITKDIKKNFPTPTIDNRLDL